MDCPILPIGSGGGDSVNLLLNPGDTTAPTTTDDLPGAFTTAPQTVTLTAADDRWGVAETAYLAGADPADPSDPANHPLTYDPAHRPVLDEGERIRYFSTDLAGNAEAVRTVTATVDHTAPTSTDDVPAAEQDGPLAVTLDATDAGAGVAAIRYLAGADPADPTDPANAPLTYDPAHRPVLAPGERIRYSAVDALGNTETAKTSAIVLARTPAPRPTRSPRPTPRRRTSRPRTPRPTPRRRTSRLRRPTPRPSPGAPLAPATPAPPLAAPAPSRRPDQLRLPRTTIHLAATPTRAALLVRGLRVSQAVPGAGRVTWTLAIAGGPTLGRRTLTARGASTATARIRVTTASGRRALRAHGRRTLVLTHHVRRGRRHPSHRDAPPRDHGGRPRPDRPVATPVRRGRRAGTPRAGPPGSEGARAVRRAEAGRAVVAGPRGAEVRRAAACRCCRSSRRTATPCARTGRSRRSTAAALPASA